MALTKKAREVVFWIIIVLIIVVGYFWYSSPKNKTKLQLVQTVSGETYIGKFKRGGDFSTLNSVYIISGGKPIKFSEYKGKTAGDILYLSNDNIAYVSGLNNDSDWAKAISQ